MNVNPIENVSTDSRINKQISAVEYVLLAIFVIRLHDTQIVQLECQILVHHLVTVIVGDWLRYVADNELNSVFTLSIRAFQFQVLKIQLEIAFASNFLHQFSLNYFLKEF